MGPKCRRSKFEGQKLRGQKFQIEGQNLKVKCQGLKGQRPKRRRSKFEGQGQRVKVKRSKGSRSKGARLKVQKGGCNRFKARGSKGPRLKRPEDQKSRDSKGPRFKRAEVQKARLSEGPCSTCRRRVGEGPNRFKTKGPTPPPAAIGQGSKPIGQRFTGGPWSEARGSYARGHRFNRGHVPQAI